MNVPIACNLNALSPARRRKLKAFIDRAAGAVIDTRELPRGYRFRLAGFHIASVAAAVDLWRQSCPFYEFQIDLRGEDGALWLTLRGRKGVKEYFPLDAPPFAAKRPKPRSR